MHECDYCDGTDLAYELDTGRGTVVRCIPCLAIERAQPGVGWESWQHHSEDIQQHILKTTNDYLRVLARCRQDDPIIKRDPDEFDSTVSEDTRTFFQNFMGADAHKRPSELMEGG